MSRRMTQNTTTAVVDLGAIRAVADRVEVVGRAVLIQADCRDVLAGFPFHNHVAALAKADQIGKRVCLVCGIELAERHDVVDRNTGSDDFRAPLASPAVPLDSRSASNKPSFAAISGNAADIVGSVHSRLFFSFVGRMAGLATKAPSRFALVLARKPRLQLKVCATMCAIMKLARHSVQLDGAFSGKGIGRAKPYAPLVPRLVVVRHSPNRHVPLAPAGLAAKAGGMGAIRLHHERLKANLTGFFEHMSFIAPTTGVAKYFDIAVKRITDAQRQGDFFVEAVA